MWHVDYSFYVNMVNMVWTSYLQVVTSEQFSTKHWQLTEEGIEVAEKGSHEAQVFNAVPSTGITQAELMVQ